MQVRSWPLVVAILEPDDSDDERGFHTYLQAYGLEMQMDEETHARTVLLVDYNSVHVFASENAEQDEEKEAKGIESESREAYRGAIPLHEMGEVHAGVHGLSERDELASLPDLRSDCVRWILLPLTTTVARLEEVRKARLTVILHACLDSPDSDIATLAKRVSGLLPASRMALAIEPLWTFERGKAMSPEESSQFCLRVARTIRDIGGAEPEKVLYGGAVDPDRASDWTSQPGIHGLFLNYKQADLAVSDTLVSVLQSIRIDRAVDGPDEIPPWLIIMLLAG